MTIETAAMSMWTHGVSSANSDMKCAAVIDPAGAPPLFFTSAMLERFNRFDVASNGKRHIPSPDASAASITDFIKPSSLPNTAAFPVPSATRAAPVKVAMSMIRAAPFARA